MRIYRYRVIFKDKEKYWTKIKEYGKEGSPSRPHLEASLTSKKNSMWTYYTYEVAEVFINVKHWSLHEINFRIKRNMFILYLHDLSVFQQFSIYFTYIQLSTKVSQMFQSLMIHKSCRIYRSNDLSQHKQTSISRPR